MGSVVERKAQDRDYHYASSEEEAGMKKRQATLALAGLLFLAAGLKAVEDPKTAPATHVTQEQIQEFIAKMPQERISDLPIRAVDVGGYRVGVFAVVRPKAAPEDAIYHDTNMTEILYILKGSATLITGGTIPDGRPPARPGGNFTGTRIDGGTSRHVVPGDVIITPGRTPHWWQNLESDMSYLVFRPDPDGKLPLK
jgi:mannose-6-phosphate isomerase-like protein (cupin superfamily)